jgi:uncharacterized repeat protein (TIGR01451 family)
MRAKAILAVVLVAVVSLLVAVSPVVLAQGPDPGAPVRDAVPAGEASVGGASPAVALGQPGLSHPFVQGFAEDQTGYLEAFSHLDDVSGTETNAAKPWVAGSPDYGLLKFDSIGNFLQEIGNARYGTPNGKASPSSAGGAASLDPNSSLSLNPSTSAETAPSAGAQRQVTGSLVISATILTQVPSAGQPVAFRVGFENVGTVPWPGGMEIRVEIRDSNGNSRGTAAGTFGPALQPGQSGAILADWLSPTGGEGQYTYLANLLSDSVVVGTSQAGNLTIRPARSTSVQTVEQVNAPTSIGGSQRVALVPNASGAFGGTGPLWTSIPEIPGISFTNLPLSSVSAGFLAPYDTVVLVQVCSISTALSGSQKADLITWLSNGGKLLIYDSDACSGSNTPDYSWLVYPFSTNNPGQMGASGGALTIMEENSLSSADPASPYYVNTADIVANTDAVGDSNVMVTRDAHWYVDMQSRNVNNVTGYTHAYAEYDHGLIIYNGLDVDYIANQWLRKMWVLELQQPWDPSGLPHGEPVVGTSSIQVSPVSVPADGASAITVTVTVRDANGNRQSGQKVRLTSSRGTLDVFGASFGVTDSNGRFVTTVRSSNAGASQLTAQLASTQQAIGSSATVTFAPIGGGTTPPTNRGSVLITGVKGELPLSGWYPSASTQFLQNVFGDALLNHIDVSVDWSGSAPGRVDFIVNGSTHSLIANVKGASYDMDMGRQLHANANELRIVAYNAQGQASQTQVYSPFQWEVPDWLNQLLNDAQNASQPIASPKSASLRSSPQVSLPGIEVEQIGAPSAINIWFKMPPKSLISKLQVPVGEFETKGWQFFVKITIPLDGGQDLEIRGGPRYLDESEQRRAAGYERNGLSILGTELTGEGYLYGRLHFELYALKPTTIGFGGNLEGSITKERTWLALLYFLGIPDPSDEIRALPLVGEQVYQFIARIATGYIKVEGRAGFEVAYDLEPARRFNSFDMTLGFGGEVGLRSDIGIAELSAAYGVDADTTFICLRNAVESGLTGNVFCDLVIKGGGRMIVKVKSLDWEYKVSEAAGFCQKWEANGTSSSCMPTHALASSPQRQWSLIEHVEDRNYAIFRGAQSTGQPLVPFTIGSSHSSIQSQATITNVLVSNIFPYTEPSLAINPINNDALLMWIHDDISKPVGQSQEVYASRWNGSTWNTPSGVTNDNFMDGGPKVAWADNGAAVAIWQRVNDRLPITATFNLTTARAIEIATSVYSATTNSWSAVSPLTSNDVLDATPDLARNTNGQLLAIWRQNDAGLLGGTVTQTDRIVFAFYNNGWNTPATAVDSIPGLVDLSVGHGNGVATVAYTQYSTPTGFTTPTLQLFTSQWNGSAWSMPTRRTDDSIGHRRPRVAYNAANQSLVAWLAGTNLNLLNLSTGNNVSLDLPVEVGSVDEFQIVQDGIGNIAATFIAQTNQRDLFVAFFDRSDNLWGRPQQLTDDHASEAYPTAGMDSTGRLLMAYAVTAVNSVTRTATTATGQVFTFTVPVEGQTDLVTLSHQFFRDLSIGPVDPSVSNDHPSPGATVVLSATIHNSGDLPVSNIPIAFYDGNPVSGGTLIRTVAWPGPLAAGFTATITSTYSVPTTGGQRQPFVVIDPANAIAESDETNNSASLTAFGPDLTIATAYADSWGGSDVGLVTLVQNIGTTSSPPATLAFHQNAITGTLVLTDTVPRLSAGQTITLTTPWSFGTMSQGDYPLVAEANPFQIDFTETFTDNNVASLTLRASADLAVSPLYFWADRRIDGMVLITGTIYNFGSIAAVDVPVSVYADNPLSDTARLFSATIPSIPPASSVTITGAWNAPAAGYALYLWADPGLTITETTRANNLASISADFGLDVQPVPDTVVCGTTTTYTLSIDSRNGFIAPVSLAATGAPAGASYLLGDSTVIPRASIVLTITADASTPEGKYLLNIQASSGNLTHTLPVTVNIVAPNFAVSAIPASQSLAQEDATSFTVAIAPYHGFAQPVTLSVTGLPTGTAASIAPNPISAATNAVITVMAAITATPGTYSVTIVARTGGISHTASVSLTIVPATRDLSVSKTLYSGSLFTDTDLQYRIYYYLSGNSSATNVVITDTLPVSLTYVSDSNTSGFTAVVADRNVVWSKPRVLPNESGYIYLTAHISSTVSAGTLLTNTVEVTNTRTETNYANNVYADTRTVLPRTRDMAVSTVLNSGAVVGGNGITYRIYVVNQGNTDANNIIITNTLPVSLTYVADTNSYGFTTVVTGSTVMWTKPTLAAGTGAYLYLTARISDTVQAGSLLTNTSKASTSDVDVNPANDTYTYTLTAQTATKDMAVSKSLIGGSASPGNNLTYRIYYQNNGNSGADNVVITDTLPISTSYVSSSSSYSPTITSSQVVWPLGRVPGSGYSGYSGSVDLVVGLADQVPIGTILTNTADIGASSLETTYANNRATDTRTVIPGTSNLYLTKALQDYYAAQGSLVAYRLYYQNYNADAATNVVLTDTLPIGVAYVGSSGASGPTLFGNTVTWNLGSVPGGVDNTIYLTVSIPSGLAVGTVLTNTAIITATNDSSPSNNAASDVHTVVAGTRDLYVSKALSSGNGVIGSDMVYQIYYGNFGTARVGNVILTDTLPAEVSFVSASGAFAPTRLGNLLIWNLGTVPSQNTAGYDGNLYVTVHLSETTTAGVGVCNRVDISTIDTETGDYQNTGTDCRVAQAPTRDVSVSKGLYTGTPAAGNTLTYVIYYYNTGNSPAANVVITDTLPSGMSYDPAYAGSGYGGWTRVVSDSQVIWTRPALVAGESGYVFVSGLISGTVSPGTMLTNTARIATTSMETDVNNNESSAGSRVLSSGVDLGVSNTWVGGSRVAGQSLTYRLSYRNGGVRSASNPMITETLPAEMTYSSWSYSGNYWNFAHMGNLITWTRSTVYGGESGYVDLTVGIADVVPSGTVLTNTVEIASSDSDDDPSDNRAAFPLTIHNVSRDLSIAKGVSSGTAAPGQDITYWLYYQNHGTSAAANVRVTDTLPDGASFVSASGGVTPLVDGNTVVWSLGTIQGQYATGYDGALYLTVHISDSVSIGSSLCNRADIATADLETGLMANTSMTCSTIQVPTRDMYISKALSGGSATPGNNLTYRIYFSNQGNSAADNVLITDTLPVSTTFASWSGYIYNPDYRQLDQSITPIVNGNQVVWNLGTVVAGGSGYLYPVMRLSAGAVAGTSLINAARVSTRQAESDYTNNRATDTRTVIAGTSNLYLSKALQGYYAAQGSLVAYRLYYQNYNADAATNVVLTDTLPNGVAYVGSSGASAPAQSGNTLTWNLGAVPGGVDNTIYLTVSIPSGIAVGTVLTNTAIITATNEEWPSNNVASDVHTVVAGTRDVYVRKALSSGNGAIGSDMVYQIYYANLGTASVGNVLLTDTLPAEVSFVSASGAFSPTRVGNLLIWNLGTVPSQYAAGYDGYLYVTVHLSETTTPGVGVCNRVDISTIDTETGDFPNANTDCRVAQAPTRDVSVSKSLYAGTPGPGSVLTYLIYYYNGGNSEAGSVTMTDTLPLGMSYDSSFADSGYGGWTRVVSGSQVIWTRPALAAGESGYVFASGRIEGSVLPRSLLTNTARIATSDAELDYGNNVSSASSRALSSGVDLGVSKTWIGGSRVAGQSLTYRLSYQNNGAISASNPTITETLPGEMTYSSWSYSGNYWNFVRTGNVITWTRSTVNGGESGYIDLTVNVTNTVANGTALTNTVEIASSDSDDSPSDNRAALPLTIYSVSRDLSISKSLNNGTVAPGQDIIYRLYYRNYGTSAAASVRVTDRLPSGVSFVSASGGVTPTVAGNTVSWSLGTVPGQYATGYSGSLYLTVHLSDTVVVGSSLCNQVDIATVDTETGLMDNTSTACSTVEVPTRDLYISKGWNSGSATPGDNLTYRIYFYNQGNSAADNVIITDTLPVSTSFVAWSGYLYNPNFSDLQQTITATASSGKVAWNLGTLVAGGSGYLYPVVRVSANALAGTSLLNVARVTTLQPESDYSNNQSTVALTVAGNPIPTISSISPTFALAGGPVFTLTVTGTNFVNSSKIRWNGVDQPTAYVSSARLTAVIAAANLTIPGQANVTVFVPAPGGGTSNGLAFSVIPPGFGVYLPLVSRQTTGVSNPVGGGTPGVVSPPATVVPTPAPRVVTPATRATPVPSQTPTATPLPTLTAISPAPVPSRSSSSTPTLTATPAATPSDAAAVITAADLQVPVAG